MIVDATKGAATLPLLALILNRLYQRYASTQEFTLEQYELMGGMKDVVNTEIEGILPADPGQRERAKELLRAAFVGSLVNITENNQALRRRAPESDLPAHALPLIKAMVEKRLLVSDRDEHTDQVVFEVALESLFEHWGDLKVWLREQREDVKTADEIVRSATAWEGHRRNDAWLTFEGERLAAAERLLMQPGFGGRLDPARAFIQSCRQREDARRESERQRREAQDAAKRAHAVIREATALRLTSEAQAMMSGAQPGGDVRAFQQLLAADSLSSGGVDAALHSALTSRRGLLKIIEMPSKVLAVAFSPDGTRLVTGGVDHTVRMWDIHSGMPIGEAFIGHTDAVYGVAWSPDGCRIASAGYDRSVRLWDADTAEPIGAPMTGHRGRVFGVAFSADGQRIASAGADTTVRLWDGRTLQPIGQPGQSHSGWVRCVAFSPDGLHVVSGGDDRRVRLWDVATGLALRESLTGHTDVVYGVAFSPDGRRVGSASAGATVRLWDAATAGPLGEPLTDDSGGELALAFSPDGHHIVGGSVGRTLRRWDADTGQPVGEPMIGHGGWVLAVAYSPDGQRIASAAADATVRLWSARADELGLAESPDPGWLSDALRAKLASNMTYGQWCAWVSPDIDYIATCPDLPVPADVPERLLGV